MSKYTEYLRKLDTVVESFEIESNNKLDAMRNRYESVITERDKQHTEKVVSLKNEKSVLKHNYELEKSNLIDTHNKKIQSLESEKSALKRTHESEKSSLIDTHNKKIQSLESEKSVLKRNYELEKSTLIDTHNKKIQSLENEKLLVIHTVIIGCIVLIGRWIGSKSFWDGLISGLVVIGVIYGIFLWIKNNWREKLTLIDTHNKKIQSLENEEIVVINIEIIVLLVLIGIWIGSKGFWAGLISGLVITRLTYGIFLWIKNN